MRKIKTTFYGSIFVSLAALVALVCLARWNSELSWGDFGASWTYWRQTLMLGPLAGLVLGLTGFWMLAERNVFSALALSSATVMGTLVVMGISGWLKITNNLFNEPLGLALGLGVFLLTNLVLKNRFQNDSLIAVIYLMSTAGIILVSDHIAHGHHEVESHLFGNSISVPQDDFKIFFPAFVILGVLACVFYRSWRNSTFDAVFCKIQNARSAQLSQITQLVFLFLTLMFAARNFGILVTFSLFLFAPLTALNQSKSTLVVLVLSGIYGLMLFPAGFLVSYFLDWPTGACISGAGFLVFALTQMHSGCCAMLDHTKNSD